MTADNIPVMGVISRVARRALRQMLAEPPAPIVLVTHRDLEVDLEDDDPARGFVPVYATYVEAGGAGRFLLDPVIGLYLDEGAFVLACCAAETDAREIDGWISNRGRWQ